MEECKDDGTFLFTHVKTSIPGSSPCSHGGAKDLVDMVIHETEGAMFKNKISSDIVFGDFNVYHKDWLTYSGGTDRPGELGYNFSISNDLTQMVKFPTRIPDCDSHSRALLDLFISSDASICSTMAFPPLGNSGHVLSRFPLTFYQLHNEMPHFIA